MLVSNILVHDQFLGNRLKTSRRSSCRMSSNITGLAMEDTIRIRHQIILQRHMDKQSTGMMQSNESCCGAYQLLSRGPQHSDAPQGGGMEESSFDTSSTWWHPSQVCESQN
jgi:hypothetical protein